ncbi:MULTISPECIES: hypothetical protein [unclassified Enterococcus]|uniref:hypothetical protein n=1 Tax=unclassified Enterococcus TaxID=2608891 RepID=UPI0013E9AA00|nr:MULTISPECIES: hypothetical protein [unclassified Enterococcus]
MVTTQRNWHILRFAILGTDSVITVFMLFSLIFGTGGFLPLYMASQVCSVVICNSINKKLGIQASENAKVLFLLVVLLSLFSCIAMMILTQFAFFK